MKIRNELSSLLLAGRKEKVKQNLRPTHIILFGNQEDVQMNNVFCFEDQIVQAAEFLNGKFDYITITELGRDIVRL